MLHAQHSFTCTITLIKCDNVDGVCYGPLGNIFPCDFSFNDPPFCYVKGRTVLYLTQGTSKTDSEWIAFGWLVLMLFSFRMAILYLMYHPVDRVTAKFYKCWSGGAEEQSLAGMISIRRLEGELVTFISKNTTRNESFMGMVVPILTIN
jgi:hypothetical protein